MLIYIFYAFLAYLAFKLVFGFIIPVYRTTKKVRRSFREMQEKMQQQADQHNSRPPDEQPAARPNQVGDYIDFEEVK